MGSVVRDEWEKEKKGKSKLVVIFENVIYVSHKVIGWLGISHAHLVKNK